MKTAHVLALSVVLASSVPLAAWAQKEHAHDEAAMVEAADTPAEHEALAEHYRELAEKARKKAAQHRDMGERYGGKVMKKQGMRDHCMEIASLEDKLAAEYDKLAEAHEAEAGE